MAIENERKYVMSVDNTNEFLESLKPGAKRILDITQGYLSDTTRIRRVDDGEDTTYFFTFKQKINNNLIEIEKEIPVFDYSQLWTKVLSIITKTRVEWLHDGKKWEIDFFKVKEETDHYLVMAEIEMPVGQELPESVPDVVQNNLVYLVPRNDSRFINKNIIRPKAIRTLVRELKNGTAF